MPEGEAGVSRLPGPVGAILRYAKEQYFLIGLGLGIVIASQHQVPGTQQGFKETVVTYLCVSLIFLITGCTLPTKVLLKNYSRWKTHLYMQVQCFLVTSAVAFGVVSATATNTSFMDPGLLIGMVLVGVVPTTISSNVVLTRQANGNTALTVVESTVGNLLAPFLTPLLIKMYTSTGAWYTKFLPQNDDDYGVIYARVFKQLGLSMFVPLVSHMNDGRRKPVLNSKLGNWASAAKSGTRAYHDCHDQVEDIEALLPCTYCHHLVDIRPSL